MNRSNYTAVIVLTAALALGGCAATGANRSTGEVVDDVSVAAKVKSALLADEVTDGLDISVEVDRGRVQLNGFADDATVRERAATVAAGVAGVSSVTNNLRIAAAPRRVGEYIDDKVLGTRIKAALAESASVDALDIEVEVNRGVVTLGGFVDDTQMVAAAENAIRYVDGITRVVNNIAVR